MLTRCLSAAALSAYANSLFKHRSTISRFEGGKPDAEEGVGWTILNFTERYKVHVVHIKGVLLDYLDLGLLIEESLPKRVVGVVNFVSVLMGLGQMATHGKARSVVR